MSSKLATPSPQGARPRSNYALFLGDLSIFCCEKDIEEAFESYGEIVNVRIQRSKETSRALSYGFIEFSCETAAVTAMNEMNSFVLKGRPLRIRWAAKRNQPVKSENAALHTAATIFVKFASQTGIIVSEQLMREHFSVFGLILDATIRTISIDEVYNRSKGYGFVNFVNDESQDGLAVAYKAAAELQNATVNGVNYRCEVGHKHQPNKVDNDSVSMGAYSSGSVSMAMPVNLQRPGFLPSLSPQAGYYQQTAHSGATVNSGGASANNSVSSGPSSPHPASFFPVNPAAQQQGGMSSNVSVGGGSVSGVYPQYNTSPHAAHPMSAIVSTISYVPTAGMPNIYTGQQGVPPQGGAVYGSPTHSQTHFTPAQQQYYQQQQQFLQQQQQQYYQQQQQQQQHGHNNQYYAAQQSMFPAQAQGYYNSQQASQQAQQQAQYYQGGEQYPPQGQTQQQFYAQGYYPSHMSPSGGSVSSKGRRPAPAYEGNESGYLNEHMLSQQTQGPSRNRRVGMAQPLNQNYMHGHQPLVPVEAAQPSGRRSQRNISNQSNISEITSATLNELQGDDEDEEDEEEQQDEEVDEEEDAEAAANAAAMISGLRMDSTDDMSQKSPVNAIATKHLKSTLQIQATPQPINCKLSERRRRNVSGGSNTTEITAQVLYDLQQQEQRLEQEEEEEGCIEPPKSQPSSPTKGSPRAVAAKSPKPSPAHSPKVANKQKSGESTPLAPRARESSATASIAPFTLSAEALDEIQQQAEASDKRRTRRSSSERSNQSDITAALAFMGVDAASVSQQFLVAEAEDDNHSSAENSVSVCICGKSDPSYVCPFGTSACSCVYKATY